MRRYMQPPFSFQPLSDANSMAIFSILSISVCGFKDCAARFTILALKCWLHEPAFQRGHPDAALLGSTFERGFSKKDEDRSVLCSRPLFAVTVHLPLSAVIGPQRLSGEKRLPLVVAHIGSHVVAGIPNLLSSQAIIKSSEPTNRRSLHLLGLCLVLFIVDLSTRH